MKKTLIALAAVAVTSTAFAQNVTISGRLDMGTVSNKTTETETGFNATSKNSTLAGANGTKTGSRITFAGTEDLGGGLTAFFNIESSLNNSVIGNRNLFVGARGSFGSVQIGRYLNTFSAIRDSHYSIAGVAGGAFLNQHLNFINIADNESVVDIGGQNGLLAGGGAPTAAQATANAGVATALRGLLGNGLANRSNNTLAYTTPNFSGFTATVGIVDDKTSADASDAEGDTKTKTKGQSISVAYSAGPLSARLTTGSGKVTSSSEAIAVSDFVATATPARGDSSAKVSDTALIVSYNFGMAQAYIMNNRTKGTLQNFRGVAVNGTGIKTNATEIGAKMPIGQFEPFVTVGRGKIKAETAGVQGVNLKTSAYQLGLNYNLSKRTSVYASTGQFKAKQDDYTSKTTGYGVGIVHMF